MPHPATDAHVHLARHPEHPDAVTATITGAGTYTARALLTVHGFRQVGEQTMILARIDHEEPHYAHQAAHALREEGVIVHITPGLQEDIDTEWTWANYRMHWLNRDEIRDLRRGPEDPRRHRLGPPCYPPPHPRRPYHPRRRHVPRRQERPPARREPPAPGRPRLRQPQ
ncbi:hypothetical protein [Streptomyces sp. NPDC019890]|uniref:hypothetical protein n=1 Tax=Streptomyces sp. NPDC019890 TaxID=3365064 RepID=UPI00384E47BD